MAWRSYDWVALSKGNEKTPVKLKLQDMFQYFGLMTIKSFKSSDRRGREFMV
jgi:hypothetical protein